MADTKISALSAGTAAPGDEIPVNRGGTNYKITAGDILKQNSGTLTASAPALDLTQTWNASGVTFTGLKFNPTDTASASGSLLMDLQVGGSSKFSVRKDGRVTIPAYPGVLEFSGQWSMNGASSGLTFSSAAGADYFRFTSSFLRTISTAAYAWTSGSDPNTAADLILTRKAAANLQLGAADAAAPVAQTLGVQSVVAGTSNTAGANFTIRGSQGTGTGAGGSIIFQTAPAGSSGTSQNALETALTINSDKSLTLGGLTINPANGAATFIQTFGILMQTSNEFGIRHGNNDALVVRPVSSGSPNILLRNASNATQAHIWGEAANTLALRNGTNAQESRVYGSYTSATNYQRTSVKTVRESSGALSGASYTTTIAIPAYANLIGVTTRVTTAITGATTYDVGDGTDVDLWGAAIGIAEGTASATGDFTATGAVGAAGASRTITLTANGSNFTGGVVEICAHYLFTEAD